jgi:hypothetical protein
VREIRSLGSVRGVFGNEHSYRDPCFLPGSGDRVNAARPRRLETSSPGVGFSVERVETIARENGLQLIE